MLGKLTRVQAPGVGDRTFSYLPGTDRLASESHPESGTTSYQYSDNGKLKKRIDAAGAWLFYSYDGANRLESVQTSADPTYDLTISYDNPRSDNRKTVSNGHVTTEYAYDSRARLTGRTDTVANPTPGMAARLFATLYTLDDYDNVEAMAYPTGRIVTYTPDELRRIRAVADATRNYASDITYHPTGQVEGLTSGNRLPNATMYYPLNYRPADQPTTARATRCGGRTVSTRRSGSTASRRACTTGKRARRRR